MKNKVKNEILKFKQEYLDLLEEINLYDSFLKHFIGYLKPVSRKKVKSIPGYRYNKLLLVSYNKEYITLNYYTSTENEKYKLTYILTKDELKNLLEEIYNFRDYLREISKRIDEKIKQLKQGGINYE